MSELVLGDDAVEDLERDFLLILRQLVERSKAFVEPDVVELGLLFAARSEKKRVR